MKITVLNENYVDKQNLCAEHGLSLLVETENVNILFDTGQNYSVVNNYEYLTSGEAKIDFIVLSHGHYDHTGGLAKNSEFFSKLCEKVVASKYVFDRHLRKKENEFEFIGIEKKISKKFDFLLIDKEYPVNENITIYSSINRYYPFVADLRLFCEIDGEILKDPFRDELYLVVKENGKTVLITGCSHAGIMNIITDFKERTGIDKIDYLIGGMHLFRSDEKTLNEVVRFFENGIKVNNIITGHCTGLEPFFKLKKALDNTPVVYMKTGEVFEI